jgi:hypothetical protein
LGDGGWGMGDWGLGPIPIPKIINMNNFNLISSFNKKRKLKKRKKK